MTTNVERSETTLLGIVVSGAVGAGVGYLIAGGVAGINPVVGAIFLGSSSAANAALQPVFERVFGSGTWSQFVVQNAVSAGIGLICVALAGYQMTVKTAAMMTLAYMIVGWIISVGIGLLLLGGIIGGFLAALGCTALCNEMHYDDWRYGNN